MVDRHGLDASDGTGDVFWVQADLRVPAQAVDGAKKVRLSGTLYARVWKRANVVEREEHVCVDEPFL